MLELNLESSRSTTALAVDNAKNVYEGELDKTIDKVSTKAKATFESLNSMMQKFRAGN